MAGEQESTTKRATDSIKKKADELRDQAIKTAAAKGEGILDSLTDLLKNI